MRLAQLESAKAVEAAEFRVKAAIAKRAGKRPSDYPTGADRRKAIEAAKAAAAELHELAKSPKPVLPKLFPDSMAVGQIGRIRRLCNIVFEEEVHREFRVQQVIDKQNMLIRVRDELNKKDVTLWLRTDTSGFVDGRDYQMDDACYEVVGTKTYKTAIGSNTVFQLVPIDVADLVAEGK